eukprot:COSAG01_NODE_429_length_17183_cov_22.990869_5_plen_71_part_00
MLAPAGAPAYIGITSLPLDSCTPCPFPGELPARKPTRAPGRWHCSVILVAKVHEAPLSVEWVSQVEQSPA